MEQSKLRSISYIRVPEDLKAAVGGFEVDPSVMLPVQRPQGQNDLRESDMTIEAIVAGMLTVIAYDEHHKDFEYFRNFVLAIQPDIVQDLNTAAIAKQQKKDWDFSEELFLTVYHLLPQAASCVNLATLYSYRSVAAEENGENYEKADEYLNKCKLTLLDGLRRFGEDELILSEIASFEGYVGDLDNALDYAERYLKVASEGERKEEMKKFHKELKKQLEADEAFKEAYDFIMLDMPEKALQVIDKFIEGNPKVWNGFFLKGWACRKAKKYEEAKEALLQCLKLGESNGEIYNELAICELEDGDRELAKTYLNTACDLDPQNLTAMSNLAYLLIEDEEFDEARYYLEKARILAGDDEIIQHLIASYEEKTGEKIGEKITEEIIPDEDNEAVEGAEEHHCGCGHHHEEGHECGCGHHHEDGDEHHCCGDHDHEGEEHHCCGGHHHDEGEEHHCCCGKH